MLWLGAMKDPAALHHPISIPSAPLLEFIPVEIIECRSERQFLGPNKIDVNNGCRILFQRCTQTRLP
jgi:hypothetical protein